MKKPIYICLLFLLLAAALVNAQDHTAAQRLLIERFYQEVYIKGDTGVIKALVAETYVDHNQARWPNRDGIARIVHLLHVRLPDLTVTVDEWYFRADHVVVQATFSGTLDGYPMRWVTMDAYRVEDGKLAEAWHLPLADKAGLPPLNSRSSGVRL